MVTVYPFIAPRHQQVSEWRRPFGISCRCCLNVVDICALYIHKHLKGPHFIYKIFIRRIRISILATHHAAAYEQGKSEGFDSCDRLSNLTRIGFKSSICQPVWPWNLMDDLKKKIGYFFYTTSSFVLWIKSIGDVKLELQSGNAQFRSKLAIFCRAWPWKTIGHLFYTTPSFVHRIKSIGEFKLEFQSGNAQFGSKLVIFCPVWPWNLMDDLQKQ